MPGWGGRVQAAVNLTLIMNPLSCSSLACSASVGLCVAAALEAGDLAEFNGCQAMLKELYPSQACTRSHAPGPGNSSPGSGVAPERCTVAKFTMLEPLLRRRCIKMSTISAVQRQESLQASSRARRQGQLISLCTIPGSCSHDRWACAQDPM